MLNALHFLLYPIIAALRFLFKMLEMLTGSAGLSIIFLAIMVSILLAPLQKRARRVEDRFQLKQDKVNEEVAVLKQTLKSEALFRETEKVYEKLGYHPIQSMVLGLSFFVSIPVLISALLLFTTTALLDGKSFLFIADLAKPDGLLFSFNILPFIMSAVTILDANFRFKDDRSSRYKFYFVAFALLALVYPLPSGLVLYWTTSNIISFYMMLKSNPE